MAIIHFYPMLRIELSSLSDPETLAIMSSKEGRDFAKIVLSASSMTLWQVASLTEQIASLLEIKNERPLTIMLQ